MESKSTKPKLSFAKTLENEALKALDNVAAVTDRPLPFIGKPSEVATDRPMGSLTDALLFPITELQRGAKRARTMLPKDELNPVVLNQERIDAAREMKPEVAVGNPFSLTDVAATYGKDLGRDATFDAISWLGNNFGTDDPVAKPWEVRENDIYSAAGQLGYDSVLYGKAYRMAKALQNPAVQSFAQELAQSAARNMAGGMATGLSRGLSEPATGAVDRVSQGVSQSLTEGALSSATAVAGRMVNEMFKRGIGSATESIQRWHNAQPKTGTYAGQTPRQSLPAPVNEPAVIDVAPIDEPLLLPEEPQTEAVESALVAGVGAVAGFLLGEKEAEAATIPDAELVGKVVKRFAAKVVKKATKIVENGIERVVEVPVIGSSIEPVETGGLNIKSANIKNKEMFVQSLQKNLTPDQIKKIHIDGMPLDPSGSRQADLFKRRTEAKIQFDGHTEKIQSARALLAERAGFKGEELEKALRVREAETFAKLTKLDNEWGFTFQVAQPTTPLDVDPANWMAGSKLKPELRQRMIEDLGPNKVVYGFGRPVSELPDMELMEAYKAHSVDQAEAATKAGTERARAHDIVPEKEKSEAYKRKASSLKAYGDQLTFNDVAQLTGIPLARLVGSETAESIGIGGIANQRFRAILAANKDALIKIHNERMLNRQKSRIETRQAIQQELVETAKAANKPTLTNEQMQQNRIAKQSADVAKMNLVDTVINQSGFDIRDIARALLYESYDPNDPQLNRITAKFVRRMSPIELAKALNGNGVGDGWLGRKITYTNERYEFLKWLRDNPALQDTNLWIQLFGPQSNILTNNKFKSVMRFDNWRKKAKLSEERIAPEWAEVGELKRISGHKRSEYYKALDGIDRSPDEVYEMAMESLDDETPLLEPKIRIDMDELQSVSTKQGTSSINPIAHYEVIYNDRVGNRIRQAMTGEDLLAIQKAGDVDIVSVNTVDELAGKELRQLESDLEGLANQLNSGIAPELVTKQFKKILVMARKHLAKFGYKVDDLDKSLNLPPELVQQMQGFVDATHFVSFTIRKWPQLEKTVAAILDMQELPELFVNDIDDLFDRGHIIRQFKAKYSYAAELYEKALSDWDNRRNNVPEEEITSKKAEILGLLDPEGRELFQRIDRTFEAARTKIQEMGKAAGRELINARSRAIVGTRDESGFIMTPDSLDQTPVQRLADVVLDRLLSNRNYIGQKHHGTNVVTFYNDNGIPTWRTSDDSIDVAKKMVDDALNNPAPWDTVEIWDRKNKVIHTKTRRTPTWTAREKQSNVIDSIELDGEVPLAAFVDKLFDAGVEVDQLTMSRIGELVDRSIRQIDESLAKRSRVPRPPVTLEMAYKNAIDQAEAFSRQYASSRLKNDAPRILGSLEIEMAGVKRNSRMRAIAQARRLLESATAEEKNPDRFVGTIQALRSLMAYKNFFLSVKHLAQNVVQELINIGLIASRHGAGDIFISTYRHLMPQLRSLSIFDKDYKTKLIGSLRKSVADPDVFRAVSRIVKLNVVAEGGFVNEIIDPSNKGVNKLTKVITAFSQSAEAHNQLISALTFAKIGKAKGLVGPALDAFVRSEMIKATPRRGNIYYPHLIRGKDSWAEAGRAILQFHRWPLEFSGHIFMSLRDTLRAGFDLKHPPLIGPEGRRFSARAAEGRSLQQGPWMLASTISMLGIEAATNPAVWAGIGLFGIGGPIATSAWAWGNKLFADGATSDDYLRMMQRYPNSLIVSRNPLKDWNSEYRAALEEFAGIKNKAFMTDREKAIYGFLTEGGLWALADYNMQKPLGIDGLGTLKPGSVWARMGQDVVNGINHARKTGDWTEFYKAWSGGLLKSGFELKDYVDDNGRKYYMNGPEKVYIDEIVGPKRAAVAALIGAETGEVSRHRQNLLDRQNILRTWSNFKDSLKNEYIAARKKGTTRIQATRDVREQMQEWHAAVVKKYSMAPSFLDGKESITYYKGLHRARYRAKPALQKWLDGLEETYARDRDARLVGTNEARKNSPRTQQTKQLQE